MPKRQLSAEQREKNRIRSNAWAAANREKARARAADWYAANRLRAKESFEQKRASDPEAYCSARRARREKSKDEINRKRAAVPSDAPSRESARLRTREWSERNADRKRKADAEYYQAATERIRHRVRMYRIANPGKARAMSAAKKAAIAQRTPKWLTMEDRRAIEAVYTLAARKSVETGEAWHVDHIIPLRGRTVSGLHVPGNLRAIPGSENMRKHNRFDASNGVLTLA